MKAMLFAAGLGTRLKPFTDTMPKALVPLAGVPLLEHIILKLKHSGFDEIIVNVHHFAEQIIRFLEEKNNFGIHIKISDERSRLLETGGGIKHAAWFFDDGKPFLVHNVDIFSDVDLSQIYQHHVQQENVATLLVSRRKTSRYLLFNDKNKLNGWINTQTGEVKPPNENINPSVLQKLAFSGIHVLSPAVFELMKNEWQGKFSIIDFYLSAMKNVTIGAYEVENLNLIDVGKQENLAEAEKIIRQNIFFN
jgi:NDP-sugar pyrophosphorylase family protein